MRPAIHLALALALLLVVGPQPAGGQETKILLEIPEDVTSPEVVVDGPTGRVAYTARLGRGRQMVAVFGDRRSGPYAAVLGPLPAGDGRMAIVARQTNGKSIVLVDGQASREWDAFGPIDTKAPARIAFAGDRIGYIAATGEEWFAVVGDEASGPYQSVGRRVVPFEGEADIFFGPDGERVAFRARRDDRSFVVVDGVEGEAYDWVGAPVVGSTGRVAYWANRGGHMEETGTRRTDVGGGYVYVSAAYSLLGGQWFVVAGDDRFGPYDRVSPPTWSGDGSTVAFTAWRGREEPDELQVVGGVETEPAETVGPVALSPDGKTTAWWVGEGGQVVRFGSRRTIQDGAMAVVVGDRRGEAFDEVWGAPAVGDDGTVAYIARRGGQWFVVVGDDPGQPFTGGNPVPIDRPNVAADGTVVHAARIAGVDHFVVRKGEATDIFQAAAVEVAVDGAGQVVRRRADDLIVDALVGDRRRQKIVSEVVRERGRAGLAVLDGRRIEWRSLELETLPRVAFEMAGRGDLKALSVSGDGRWLAGGTSNKTVEIRDLDSGRLASVLGGHARFVDHVAIDDAGRRVASATDRATRVLDVGKGETVASVAGDPARIALSGNGSRLAVVAGRSTVVHDAASGRELCSIPAYLSDLVFTSPSGSKLLGVLREDRTLVAREWSIPAGTESRSIDLGVDDRATIVLATGGRHAATIVRDVSAGRLVVRVVDLSRGREVGTATIEGKEEPIAAVAPDGRTVALGFRGQGAVVLLDVARGREKARLLGAPADRARPPGLLFVGEGDRLVGWDTGGRVVVWDVPR